MSGYSFVSSWGANFYYGPFLIYNPILSLLNRLSLLFFDSLNTLYGKKLMQEIRKEEKKRNNP